MERHHVDVTLLGERLDTRALEHLERVVEAPAVVRAGRGGHAVLFRYGAVALFDLDDEERRAFLDRVRPLAKPTFDDPEREEAEIRVEDSSAEGAENGVVVVRALSIPHMQAIAEVLAKSVVLAHHEEAIADAFDRIEPLALALAQGRGHRVGGRRLQEQIGHVLLAQHRMVGRVEVEEKPEFVWERPDVERLYTRLIDEYELAERHGLLDRKLDLISRTAQTLLSLEQDRRALRVEWIIVLLIAVEIVLFVYELSTAS